MNKLLAALVAVLILAVAGLVGFSTFYVRIFSAYPVAHNPAEACRIVVLRDPGATCYYDVEGEILRVSLTKISPLPGRP